MLNILFYHSNQDLLLKLGQTETNRVICPSPTVADNLRAIAPEMDIITISKWTSDHLKVLGLQRARKSELMIKFAGFWRSQFPEEKSAFFHEAFEQFTELRSFTLDLALLAEFFQELDPKVVRSILIFWTYLESNQLIDEHLGYQKLLESKYHKAVSFVGFRNMSGVQVDMLKELGQKHEINVFLPVGIFDRAQSSDWIRWLPIDNLNIPHLEIQKKNTEKLNVLYLQEGKGNVALDAFYKHFKDHDIVLTGTQLGLNEYQELQHKNSFFKTNEDIFSNEQSMAHELLMAKVSTGAITIEELNDFFVGHKKYALESANYRLYKIIEIYKEALVLYSELNPVIDNFAIEVLSMVVGLNSPRVFMVTIEKNHKRLIADLGSLQFRDDSKPVALYATEQVSGFKVNEKILSEAMTKALRAIGPIKRAGLEFNFQKLDLFNILKHPDSVLMIDRELLDMDMSWRDILKHFELSAVDLVLDYKIKSPREILDTQIKKGKRPYSSFSATRIQSYIDCPRSFYFRDIENLDSTPDEKIDLESRELGQLEHLVIQKYYENKKRILENEVDFVAHENICTDVFFNYLSEKALVLSEANKSSHYHELIHYSLNGILKINELIKELNIKSIDIEVSLPQNPWYLKGSIDCLLEDQNGLLHIFDFKRSQSAIGTLEETNSFQKIQLWVYILSQVAQKKEVGSFGYINLSDPNESKLFNESKGPIDSQSIAEAQKIVETTINLIQNETDFRDKPRNGNVCTFCKVSLYCLKGEGYE